MSLQGVQYRLKTAKILTVAARKSSLKALVTGAAGFIGSHLVEALLQRGVRVRCLVRPTSRLTWVKGLPVEIIYGDSQEKDSLGPGVKDVDLVFHLAGATRAIDAKTYFAVNARGTENLVWACPEKFKVQSSRFKVRSIHASNFSCFVGGPAAHEELFRKVFSVAQAFQPVQNVWRARRLAPPTFS